MEKGIFCCVQNCRDGREAMLQKINLWSNKSYRLTHHKFWSRNTTRWNKKEDRPKRKWKSANCLQLTFCRFAMGGIFTTELYAEHKTFGYHETVCGARNPAYCKCAVTCWRSVVRCQVTRFLFGRLCHWACLFWILHLLRSRKLQKPQSIQLVQVPLAVVELKVMSFYLMLVILNDFKIVA